MQRFSCYRVLFLAVAVPILIALQPSRGLGQPPQADRGPTSDRFEAARERMVRDDISGGGVTDARVLASMRSTPRHEFVAGPQRPLATPSPVPCITPSSMLPNPRRMFPMGLKFGPTPQ